MVFLEDKCKSPAFEVRESRKHQNIVVFPPLKQYDPENEIEFRTAYILHSIHVSFHDSEMPLSQIFTEQGIFFLLWGVRGGDESSSVVMARLKIPSKTIMSNAGS